jgi:hypothetical protein
MLSQDEDTHLRRLKCVSFLSNFSPIGNGIFGLRSRLSQLQASYNSRIWCSRVRELNLLRGLLLGKNELREMGYKLLEFL